VASTCFNVSAVGFVLLYVFLSLQVGALYVVCYDIWAINTVMIAKSQKWSQTQIVSVIWTVGL